MWPLFLAEKRRNGLSFLYKQTLPKHGRQVAIYDCSVEDGLCELLPTQPWALTKQNQEHCISCISEQGATFLKHVIYWPTKGKGQAEEDVMEVVKIDLKRSNLSEDLAYDRSEWGNRIHITDPNIVGTKLSSS